ncbi:galactofuranosyltransferase [Strigomonas culicis]|nr:galactofuranosyltransferase [Strigomonas culicis]EPY35100.1 galactofuranosyltransferase [Strigomonas culicis]|eukprot:EPY29656.1 galactofuranosyltransferase [Strigomonas culicis]
MLINNGIFSPLRNLLAQTSTLGLDDRLFYKDHPENIGYAAAVNEGFHTALALSSEQVPWVYVSNCDVRFHPTFLSEFVVKVNTETVQDAPLLLRLSQLVQQENISSRPSLSDRSVGKARLLPDYVRRNPLKKENRIFEGRYGLFFPNCFFEMSSFAVSRLHLETVGLLDENFYPAYGEDFDYKWRSEALGFKFVTSRCGLFKHYENANLKILTAPINIEFPISVLHRSEFPQYVRFQRMNYHPIRKEYRRAKWFPFSRTITVDSGRVLLPFNGKLPVDMWVRDPERSLTIWRIGEGLQCACEYRKYNISLLDHLPYAA